MFALGLNAREFQLLTENLGEFLQGHVHFEDVLSLFGSAWPDAAPTVGGVAGLAVSAAHAAVAVVAVTKMRRFDAAHRDADELLPFAAKKLAAGEELSQVVADLALDDLAKALMVFVNLQRPYVHLRVAACRSSMADLNDPLTTTPTTARQPMARSGAAVAGSLFAKSSPIPKARPTANPPSAVRVLSIPVRH